MTALNQDFVKNPYVGGTLLDLTRKSNLPMWGEKLIAPAFFKSDKMKKLLRQQ